MSILDRKTATAKTRQFSLIADFAPRIVETSPKVVKAVAWADGRTVCFEYHPNASAKQVRYALFNRIRGGS